MNAVITGMEIQRFFWRLSQLVCILEYCPCVLTPDTAVIPILRQAVCACSIEVQTSADIVPGVDHDIQRPSSKI